VSAAPGRRPAIGSRPAPACPLCGGPGTPHHRRLRDRLAPGPEEWDLSRCEDPGCRLLWLDPTPLAEDLPHAYGPGYYTHGSADPRRAWYHRGYHWLRRGYLAWRYGYHDEAVPWWQRLLGALIVFYPRRRADMDYAAMHLRARPGARLLEVGCGGGGLLQVLRQLGWDAEGVDFDEAAVARARQRGLTVHLGTVAAQHYPDGHFQAIVMSHVIEHVHDPRGLLRECRRVLADGGRLVAVTPNAASWAHARFGPHWFGLEPPRHLLLFDTGNLRRLAEEVGFQVERLVTTSRWARQVFILSDEIARTGAVGGPGARSLSQRFRGLAFELAESLRLLVQPDRGEETLMVARKDPPR
jgi:SAM-dependent methyltransferase